MFWWESFLYDKKEKGFQRMHEMVRKHEWKWAEKIGPVAVLR